MGLVGAALELRVILHTDIKIVPFDFHRLHNVIIGRSAADGQTGRFQFRPEAVVEFIAVAVALGDIQFAVYPVHLGAGDNLAGVSTQAQRAALGGFVALVGQKVNDLMGAVRVKFAGVGIRHACHKPGKGNHGHLHSQADAEIRQIVGAAVVSGGNLSVNAPVAEATGNHHTGAVGENLLHILGVYCFGINPLDVDMSAVGIACVAQSLRYGEIGIMQLHIFAHQANGDLTVAPVNPVEHGVPVAQVDVRGLNAQLPADNGRKIALFQHDGSFIQLRQGDVFNHAVGLHVAEHGNLLENGILQRLIAAQDDDVRLHAHALQFLYRMLSGLGLVFVRAAQEGNQGYMDKEAVLCAYLQGNLPHGFQKRLGFNVTNGAADFCNDHIGIGFLCHGIHKFLDFVGDVGNHLHGGTQVFAAALLIQHVPVDLAGGEIGVFIQIFINEAFIVTQIQVGFRAVLGDIHLAVLIGTHGARVNIDIGIQLLGGNLQSSGLQESAQGRGGDALAKTGNHAAGHKNILGVFHCKFLLYVS